MTGGSDGDILRADLRENHIDMISAADRDIVRADLREILTELESEPAPRSHHGLTYKLLERLCSDDLTLAVVLSTVESLERNQPERP